MSFIIGLLTAILFLDCLLLTLLILVQLPKKEAGMGTAFGGAATDALFGAGTGNALTNLTKYAAGVFFALALTLSVISAKRSAHEKNRLQDVLKQQAAVPAATTQPSLSTNLLQSLAKPATNALATNALATAVEKVATNKPATNVSAAPAK